MVNFLVGSDLLALKAAYDIAAAEERRALDQCIEASQSLGTPAHKYALVLAEKRLGIARQRKISLYNQILAGTATS